jgi:hypothetical protein
MIQPVSINYNFYHALYYRNDLKDFGEAHMNRGNKKKNTKNKEGNMKKSHDMNWRWGKKRVCVHGTCNFLILVHIIYS